MPDFYTVRYEYQGHLKQDKVFAENATTAIADVKDRLRAAEPLFIHTFMVKEVRRTYVAQAK